MYFMRYKSEMFAKFNVQKTKVKNQRWRKIKCLMLDNGIKPSSMYRKQKLKTRDGGKSNASCQIMVLNAQI